MGNVIFWFRQDLRLSDNPALHAAIKSGNAIIPFYCYNDVESGQWAPGAASRWWLHHSLSSLANDIKQCGSRLVIRKGDSVKCLTTLIKQTRADTIFINRLYEPDHIARDNQVSQELNKLGVNLQSFHGNLLYSPDAIRNQSGQPYRVFTPFYRYTLKLGFDSRVTARPKKLPAVPNHLKSDSIASLKLLPKIKWYTSFEKYWLPGESGGLQNLKRFCKSGLSNYKVARDVPSMDGTTELSPHLHFGELSSRQIISQLNRTVENSSERSSGNARDSVVRELVWREFANHILVHFPFTTDQPFQEQFARFPWKQSDRQFMTAWQSGNTGIPIIDAGMRQLWHTGWMHNRVRMVVASLLTKNANLHWLNGAKWFWDTLVDADLASNSMNWQWVAGCGVDAAPYFRIFNPVTQGKKFDPQGEYVRRWIPELKNFPLRYLHEPWNSPLKLQQEADIIIGRNYPRPIIDLSSTRKQILASYNRHRKKRA